jgi:hypothetical protein
MADESPTESDDTSCFAPQADVVGLADRERTSVQAARGHKKCLLTALLIAATSVGCTNDVAALHEGPIEDREVVLILPGLGLTDAGRRHLTTFSAQLYEQDYDVVVPDYLDRDSLQSAIDNVVFLLDDYALHDYAALHVFAYIAGTWTFNTVLQQIEIDNLVTVVYDRSPLQERAPFIATTEIPVLAQLTAGDVIFDLADTPFPQADPGTAHVGLMIENRATSFIRFYEEETLALGPVSFEAGDLGQEFDDAIHMDLDHDEMYTNFDIVGPELIHFFQNASFSNGADREPLAGDPFED